MILLCILSLAHLHSLCHTKYTPNANMTLYRRNSHSHSLSKFLHTSQWLKTYISGKSASEIYSFKSLCPHCWFLNLLALCLVPSWVHSAGHKSMILCHANDCIFTFPAPACSIVFSFKHQDSCSTDLQPQGNETELLHLSKRKLRGHLPDNHWTNFRISSSLWCIKKSDHFQPRMLGKGRFPVAGICAVRMHHRGKERRAWFCLWVEFMLKHIQKCFSTFSQILIEGKKETTGGRDEI